MTNKQQIKAQVKVKALWQWYNEKGELTCRDIKTLTGQSRGQVYTSFERYRLVGPPVCDTRAELMNEKVRVLWQAADMLGRDFLTAEEAAEALGVDRSAISSMNRWLKNHHIPEIVFKKRGGAHNKKAKEDKGDRLPPSLRYITDSYPSGLTVLSARPGDKPGQVIYTLR